MGDGRIATDLDDADIRLLIRLVDRELGHTLNPVLHLVGEVGDDLV